MDAERKAQQHRHKLAAIGCYPTDAGTIWAEAKYPDLMASTENLLKQLKPSDLFALYMIGSRIRGYGIDEEPPDHRAEMITQIDFALCLLKVEPEHQAEVMQVVKELRGTS